MVHFVAKDDITQMCFSEENATDCKLLGDHLQRFKPTIVPHELTMSQEGDLFKIESPNRITLLHWGLEGQGILVFYLIISLNIFVAQAYLGNIHDFDGCQLTCLNMSTLKNRKERLLAHPFLHNH